MEFLGTEFQTLLDGDISAQTKASSTREELVAFIKINFSDMTAFKSVSSFIKDQIILTFGKQANVVMEESAETKGKHLDSFPELDRPEIKRLRDERVKIMRKANDYYKSLGEQCFGIDFKESLKSGKVINSYGLIDEDLREAPRFNPAYESHHLALPFRMLICAPSGAGKTNLLHNYITMFQKLDQPTFDTMTFITMNSDEPLYEDIRRKYPYSKFYEGLDNAPDVNSFDKEKNNLVVFDDMMLKKGKKAMELIGEYMITCRKRGVSLFFLAQAYFNTDVIIRRQISHLAMLSGASPKDINLALKSCVGTSVNDCQLMAMYNHSVASRADQTKGVFIIDFPQSAYHQTSLFD